MREGLTLAPKSAYGAQWEHASLLYENGEGPTVRFVDSSELLPGQWSATELRRINNTIVPGDILINKDILGKDVNLVAHAIVHEVGHWTYFNSNFGISIVLNHGCQASST